MKGKSVPMRIDEATKQAINMLAAEYQLKTGKNVSANDALWTFIQSIRPDITQQVENRLGKRVSVEVDED